MSCARFIVKKHRLLRGTHWRFLTHEKAIGCCVYFVISACSLNLVHLDVPSNKSEIITSILLEGCECIRGLLKVTVQYPSEKIRGVSSMLFIVDDDDEFRLDCGRRLRAGCTRAFAPENARWRCKQCSCWETLRKDELRNVLDGDFVSTAPMSQAPIRSQYQGVNLSPSCVAHLFVHTGNLQYCKFMTGRLLQDFTSSGQKI